MKKKLNKFKITIIVILIVLAFAISVFGRYIYNNIRESYFTARQFYFSSDILTVSRAEYQYDNWGGLDVYPIEIELYSYNNQVSKLDYDLDYTVTCSTSDTDKIRCAVNSYDEDATTTATGTIYATTNTSKVTVFVTPLTEMRENETVKVLVSASTEVPYQKTISCEFTLKIQNQSGVNYSIEDVANQDYAVLKLVNTSDIATQVTLEFDPSVLRLDMNDEIYLNNTDLAVSTIDGNQYVKKVVFSLNGQNSKNVKFYKVDKTQNYSYPGVQTTSPIDVTT